MEERCAKR